MRLHVKVGIVVSSLIMCVGSWAQSAPETQTLVIDSKITQVTLYRGRAAVTRSASAQMERGVYELTFTSLPETIQSNSIQARALGGAKVVNVDYSEHPSGQATTETLQRLDARIKEVRQQIARIEEQHKINAAAGKFLDDLSAKVSSEASRNLGQTALDLEALKSQMNFISQERERLMERRLELDVQRTEAQQQLQMLEQERGSIASAHHVNRTAVVTVMCTEQNNATVELTYLVANATWQPSYNVRASISGGAAQIEYDALFTQRTGEDWNDVKLTLSTAQPTIAANPPTLSPWYVDIFRPEVLKDRMAAKAPAEPRPTGAIFGRASGDIDGVEQYAYDASVEGEGPAVSFVLPRAVTIKSNIQKQQQTRIATIDSTAKYVHVAVPSLTEAVYVRGDVINSSAYQLLPGQASIFLGQDYVGPTQLEAVAPNGEFKLHFGIDPAVKATRQLVAKKTENTGLLGGGRRTSYDYRITIENGIARAITLELWDRYPISRNEQIQIETVSLSHPLANDAQYVAEQLPQGLLKWMLNIPAQATGKSAVVVTYGVRINRAKDVETTPLPE